jgi:hypothetical protein
LGHENDGIRLENIQFRDDNPGVSADSPGPTRTKRTNGDAPIRFSPFGIFRVLHSVKEKIHETGDPSSHTVVQI